MKYRSFRWFEATVPLLLALLLAPYLRKFGAFTVPDFISRVVATVGRWQDHVCHQLPGQHDRLTLILVAWGDKKVRQRNPLFLVFSRTDQSHLGIQGNQRRANTRTTHELRSTRVSQDGMEPIVSLGDMSLFIKQLLPIAEEPATWSCGACTRTGARSAEIRPRGASARPAATGTARRFGTRRQAGARIRAPGPQAPADRWRGSRQ